MGNDSVAIWGYGKDCDEKKLPAELQKVVMKIRELNGYRLGKLRDCSINVRTKGYFYTSPHVDPLADGPHVFVLGLGSATVITFSPDKPFEEHEVGQSGGALRLGRAAEERSWTDSDLDMLFRKRSLVAFSGAARYMWRHGIRSGMEIDEESETGKKKTLRLDFWGDMKNLVKRQDERVSIVFSFADPQ